MKRILLSVMTILFSLGIVFSQSTSQNPMLNIKGVFKTDYLNITKGTPTVLQRIIKSQIPTYNSNSETQAVVITNGIQSGIPINRLDVIELFPENSTSFWQIAQLSNDLISYYDKKGTQEILRQKQKKNLTNI